MTPAMMEAMMMGAGISSGISGAAGYAGYSNMADELGDAQNQITQYLQQATGYMQPFYDAGTQGLSAYQKGLSPLQNPVQLMNQLMGGYTESPYAQFQQQQSITAANAAGAASGMLGSGAEQKELMQQSQAISSKDMQQWLNNIFGIYKGYMGGEKNLMTQGYGAAGQMGNWNMQAGRDVVSLMDAQARAQAAAMKSAGSGAGGLIGGVVGGLGL
jgi:hypothetical protein